MRESLRDHEGQFIERPMAKIEDDGEDSFFETVSVQGMSPYSKIPGKYAYFRLRLNQTMTWFVGYSPTRLCKWRRNLQSWKFFKINFRNCLITRPFLLTLLTFWIKCRFSRIHRMAKKSKAKKSGGKSKKPKEKVNPREAFIEARLGNHTKLFNLL